MTLIRKLLVLVLICFHLNQAFAKDLVIGTQIYEPPFESLAGENQSFFGFDIELMMAICKRIQVNCVFKNYNFNNLFTGLKEGKIDLAISAITITDSRRKEFYFSLPYLPSNASFLSLNKSPLKEVNDVSGKTIGLVHGTAFRQIANSMFNGNVQFKEYANNSDMMADLAKGGVDVVLIDAPFGQYWIANTENLFKQVGKPIPIGYGYGIVTLPKNGDLIFKINQALEAMENDGSYLTIYSKYFGDNPG